MIIADWFPTSVVLVICAALALLFWALARRVRSFNECMAKSRDEMMAAVDASIVGDHSEAEAFMRLAHKYREDARKFL